MPLPAGETYYSPAEAAPMLGIGIQAVRSYCCEGRLHAVKMGRVVVIPASEIERYKQDRKPRGNPNFKKHGEE